MSHDSQQDGLSWLTTGLLVGVVAVLGIALATGGKFPEGFQAPPGPPF